MFPHNVHKFQTEESAQDFLIVHGYNKSGDVWSHSNGHKALLDEYVETTEFKFEVLISDKTLISENME